MDKKMWISIISLCVAILLFLSIWMFYEKNNNINSNNQKNEVKNLINISNEVDKSENVINNKLSENKEVNNNFAEEETHYLLKNENGYIYIYYLKNNEMYLYKKTDISVNYLSESDIDDLNIGIEVNGLEELNGKLEDFE